MMPDDLRGKIVLVTGASSGIGAAVARGFAAAGSRVAIHCHSRQAEAGALRDEIVRAGGEAIVLRADVADHREATALVDRTVRHFGGLDVLINNAGAMLGRVRVFDMSPEHFDRVVNLNARSVYSTCHAALPVFRLQGHGNIVNTTSIAARTGGAPGAGLYAATKAFVSTFTKALAKEEAPHNIRINAVSPGVITTPFHDGVSSPEQMEAARQMVPLARLGTAEECVGTYLYLASDALSAYVTGQVIEVNGGQLMP